jgi:hypothetical protein
MEAADHTHSDNGAGQSPWQAHLAAEPVGRPEIPVLAALAGGFIFAKILKAIGGGDDE